jgi:MFS family permease
VSVERPLRILPGIVIAEFAGTSLWFAGNAVLPDLQRAFGLPASALGSTTSAVLAGFIVGSLVSAIFALPDRFSPARIFAACCFAGAATNLLIARATTVEALMAVRFVTGITLAGVYPVGMKIAASWFPTGLGRALGFLVAALVLGTATPHLLRGLVEGFPWEYVIYSVSAFAALGGLLVLVAVGDGPALKKAPRLERNALSRVFSSRDFRSTSFAYFGHMWEIYAAWAFVPILLREQAVPRGLPETWIPALSFVYIGAGALGCIGGGLIASRFGSARVAFVQLAISGGCCLLGPLLPWLPWPIAALVLLVWGITIAGDSPQFSTLNAAAAPRELVGTGLTVVNSIGYALSIAAVQIVAALRPHVPLEMLFLLLGVGPLTGLFFLRRLTRPEADPSLAASAAAAKAAAPPPAAPDSIPAPAR